MTRHHEAAISQEEARDEELPAAAVREPGQSDWLYWDKDTTLLGSVIQSPGVKTIVIDKPKLSNFSKNKKSK